MRSLLKRRALPGVLTMAVLLTAAMTSAGPSFSQGLRLYSGHQGVTARPGLNGLRAGIVAQPQRPGPAYRPPVQVVRPLAAPAYGRRHAGRPAGHARGPLLEQRAGYYQYSRATRESVRLYGYRYDNAETVSAGETYLVRRYAEPRAYGSGYYGGGSSSIVGGSYGSAGSGYPAAYGYPLVQTAPSPGYSYGAPVRYGKTRKQYSASWGYSRAAAVYWPGSGAAHYSYHGRERLKAYDNVYGKVSTNARWAGRGGSHFEAARRSFRCTATTYGNPCY